MKIVIKMWIYLARNTECGQLVEIHFAYTISQSTTNTLNANAFVQLKRYDLNNCQSSNDVCGKELAGYVPIRFDATVATFAAVTATVVVVQLTAPIGLIIYSLYHVRVEIIALIWVLPPSMCVCAWLQLRLNGILHFLSHSLVPSSLLWRYESECLQIKHMSRI